MTPNVACRRVRQSFRMLKINPRSVFSSNAVSSLLSPPSLSSVSTFTFSLSPGSSGCTICWCRKGSPTGEGEFKSRGVSMGEPSIRFVLGWSFSSYPMATGDDWDEFGPISEFNLLKLKTTRSLLFTLCKLDSKMIFWCLDGDCAESQDAAQSSVEAGCQPKLLYSTDQTTQFYLQFAWFCADLQRSDKNVAPLISNHDFLLQWSDTGPQK